MHNPVCPFILIRSAGLSPLSLSISWPDETEQNSIATTAIQELQQAFDGVLTILPDSPLRTAVYNTRKRFFQKQQISQQGFEKIFLADHEHQILAPLLVSIENWSNINQQKKIAEENIESGIIQNWYSIQHAAQRPDFQQALLFASHDLLNRLPAFCARSPELFTTKDRQTGLAVLQYLTRAAYKTSPLSRFTTVSLWRWQQTATLIATDEPAFLQAAKAVVTPNAALLPALYEVLLEEPAFYESLQLTLNPCITTTSDGNGWEWLYFDGENESFQRMAPNPAVEVVIRICLEQQRQLSWPALLSALQSGIAADADGLRDLMLELVALGLLSWQLPDRGLSAGWCGSLYNYLGHLPMAPVISEAAALLQWLRTAARTLPFQSIAEAQATQKQTVQQLKAFFERYNSPPPPIPAEQIFFEDVEKPSSAAVPPEVVQSLADQLADCWRAAGPQRLSPFRSALHAFTNSALALGESRPFLDFCKTFLAQKADWEKHPPVEVPRSSGKIGALLQIFKKKEDAYGAVINGLFPGGGKLMARWLHLFPSEVRDVLTDWFPDESIAFPWQGWSNANFQPALADAALAVPDGRVVGNPAFLIGDLEVQRTTDGPLLVDRVTGRRIRFSDLGLEAPETRPPAMQVLWYLGVPPVSLESLLPVDAGWEESGPGWSYRQRVVFQSLVLRRATWRVVPAVWENWLLKNLPLSERLVRLRATLMEEKLPAHFFVRFPAQKPQHVDRDSPIGLLLLEKILRGGQGDLFFTEMLPGPAQGYSAQAQEFVVELNV